MKMWKLYDNDNNDAIDDRQRTNFDQKSSLELSAQVSEQKKKQAAIYLYLSSFDEVPQTPQEKGGNL